MPTSLRLLLLLAATQISGLTANAFAQGTANAPPKVQLVFQPCTGELNIRVAVFSNGNVQINGQPVAVSAVPKILKKLTKKGSTVCLHREHPEAKEPHPNMLKVLDSIIALKLPAAFYWDSSFQQRVHFVE